jgi:hypothetical protein
VATKDTKNSGQSQRDGSKDEPKAGAEAEQQRALETQQLAAEKEADRQRSEQDAKDKAVEDRKEGTHASELEGSAAVRTDHGTGLESLAVDRDTPVGPEGNIGDDDDPRRLSPVAGMPIVGYADSGEPIIAGGVPTMTTGVPAEAAGVNDPNIGVASDTGVTLAAHEATRDQWGEGSLDVNDSSYDGTPVDRIKAGLPQNPGDGNSATDESDPATQRDGDN